MATNVGHLEATLGLNSTQLRAGLASAQASMKRAGKRMQAVGQQMTTMISLPLAAAGIASAKLASDFEANFSKIEGLVGIAGEKVNAMKSEVLALSGPTSRAPNELAEALFFVTSAGLRGQAALDVLKQSARASAAGLGETKTVADLVTSAVNAYGQANLNATQATDTLVAAVREGKAEAPELASSLGMVLPIASSLQVGFDQVGAAVAAMTRTGTKAQTAAMQLRQILASILDPSQGARDAMREMGTSAAGLRKQLREEGLVSVLGFLRKQMETNEEAMANIFPNVRALSGALDIMGGNADENVAIFERMKDSTGALDNAFAAAAKTTRFKFNQALARLKVTAIGLGELMLPMINNLMESIQSGLSAFNNLSTATKRLIIVIGGFATVAGPMIAGLGLIFTLLGSLTGPIALVVVGLTALVGVTAAYKARSMEASNAMRREQTELNRLVTAINDVNTPQEVRKGLMDKLQKDYPDFLDNLDAEKVTTKELADRLKEVNKQYENRIARQVFEEDLKKIVTEKIKLRRELEKLTIKQSNFNEAQARANEMMRTGLTTIPDVTEEEKRLNSQLDSVNAALAENALKHLKLKNEAGLLGISLAELTDALSDAGEETDDLSGDGGGGGGGIAGLVTKFQMLNPILRQSTSEFREWINTIGQAKGDFFGGEGAQFAPTDPGQGMMKGVQEAIRARMEKSIEATKKFNEELKRTFATASQIGSVFGEIGGAILNAFTMGEGGLESFLQFFKQFALRLIAQLAAIAAAAIIVNILTGGAVSAFGGAGSAFSTLASGSGGLIGGVSGMMQGLASGGFVTNGGFFQLHRDEIVGLPAGSAVTPAHIAQGNVNAGSGGAFVIRQGDLINAFNAPNNSRRTGNF